MRTATQPPTEPQPNCGRKCTQPSPGAKVKEWASGTNISNDTGSTSAAGTRTAQAQAAAEIQAVEELVARGEPQELHPERDRRGGVCIVGAGEQRQEPR